MQLKNFLFKEKNNVSFSKRLDFYAFVKSTEFKIRGVTIGIAAKWKLHLCLFLLNPKYYHSLDLPPPPPPFLKGGGELNFD